jgi:hypothetical protein
VQEARLFIRYLNAPLNTLQKLNPNSLQYLVEAFYGYGGVPRRPQQPTPEGLQKEAREAWQSLMDIEKSL